MSSEAATENTTKATMDAYLDAIRKAQQTVDDGVAELDKQYPNRGRSGYAYDIIPANEEHRLAYNTEYAAAQAEFNEAQRKFDRIYEELVVKYPHKGRGGTESRYVQRNEEHIRAWQTAYNDLQATAQTARNEAKAKFSESGDKLAVWLVESGAMEQYPDHVNEVLSWGPMSFEELQEKGAGTGWCNEFTRYLNLAHRAGVIEDGRTAKEQLFGKLARAGRLSDSTRALIEQALAEAVAEAQQTSADTAETTTGEDA